MTNRSTVAWIIVGLMGANGIVLGQAPPTTPTEREQLLQRIEQLEASNRQVTKRLADLESEQQTAWFTERQVQEVKELVRDVLADADTRPSLKGDGITAGHNGENFFLSSEDGAFLLRFEGLMQIRYVANFRHVVPGGGAAGHDLQADAQGTQATSSGFEFARANIEFNGHIGDPRVLYFLRLAVDRASTEVLAERIALGYQVKDNLAIFAGVDKGPFLREELISPGFGLAVDRSLMNAIFTEGYIQGVWANWDPTPWLHLVASINDGWRSGAPNNEYQGANLVFHAPNFAGGGSAGVPAVMQSFDLTRSDLAFTGRVDVKLAGSWDQWQDYQALAGEPFAAFVGGAFHYELSRTGTTAGNDKFYIWTADSSLKYRNLSLYGAVAGFHADVEPGTNAGLGLGPANRNAYGVMTQVGYMLFKDRLQPFARYEWINVDDRRIPNDELHMVTVGANYFIRKHKAKLVVDLVWAMQPIPSSTDLGLQNNGYEEGLAVLGLRPDQAGQRNQLALRVQFQIMF